MLNLLEKSQLDKPIVFGGNVTSILKTWLQELGIIDFVHAGVIIRSISPEDIKLSAEHIRRNYSTAPALFTVGTFAHKTLQAAGLDHGALPPTSTKDKKAIAFALNQCRNYLLRSMYHAPKGSPTLSS